MIVIVVGLQLIPPPQLAGACIEHERAVREEIRAFAIRRREIRYRIAYGREELRRHGIESERRPRAAATVHGPFAIAPRIGADVLADRDGVEAPDFATGLRVVREYSAADAELAA